MEVCHTAGLGMHIRTAEIIGRDVLVRHTFDDLRSGDEHLADIIDHEDKVRDTR